MGHDLLFTVLLNKLLAGVVTPALTAVGAAPTDPVHPIHNYTAMEILVFLVIIIGSFILRAGLSVETPGRFQQMMEVVVEFVQNMASEIIGHGSDRFVPLIGTLGLFILISNIFGLFPGLETPTGYIPVTLGAAVAVFLYYNYQGIAHHGPLGYLKTFWGPIWWVGFLLFPVEVVSNLFRLLSLSVRLYANMFVGKLLEQVFGAFVPVAVPSVMMGLHLFVSFIQAYIFMLLPAVYISLSVAEEH
jgi:F-type H+-transporting ATPase subunit a